MNAISELRTSLNAHFHWNKARVDCFARMLFALIAVRTVNLSEMAVAMSSKAEIESRYKRLHRFFAQFNIDYTVLARWLFDLFFRSGDNWSAKKLFRNINPKESKHYLNGVLIYKARVIDIATHAQPADRAVSIYLRRWEMESLFQGLKGRGFRFEDTHMTKLDRVEKLMGLLAVAFCWSHKVGEWRSIQKPIRLKRFRKSRRPQNSFFRYGFDLLRDFILHMNKQTAATFGLYQAASSAQTASPGDTIMNFCPVQRRDCSVASTWRFLRENKNSRKALIFRWLCMERRYCDGSEKASEARRGTSCIWPSRTCHLFMLWLDSKIMHFLEHP